jgi:RNA polymerase sigma factor (sigma-70 family)
VIPGPATGGEPRGGSAADEVAAAVLAIARQYLRRWRDHWTRNQREDLAQETAIRFWKQAPRLARPAALRGYVRTIARRCRGRGLRRYLRETHVSLEADDSLRHSLVASPPAGRAVAIGGRHVPFAWLRDQVGCAIDALPSLNGCLVRAYYQGFSVAELSARYELSEACVKKRIHRSRAQLRKLLEAWAAPPAPAGLGRTWHEGENR